MDKIQDVLSNQEIALRLTEAWATSEAGSVDEMLQAYDIALEHLNQKEEK